MLTFDKGLCVSLCEVVEEGGVSVRLLVVVLRHHAGQLLGGQRGLEHVHQLSD